MSMMSAHTPAISQPSTAMGRWYLFWPGCVFGSVTDERRQGPAHHLCLYNPFANEIGK
jgi:hypothetical protein